MPTYSHLCDNCQHEWDDFYSINANPPTTCPQCQQETAKRTISGGSGRGIVELTGNDLVEKIKGDAKRIEKEASTNENTYANLLGEARTQSIQTRIDQQNRIRRSK
jgi:putative FmdB family regulatory protein